MSSLDRLLKSMIKDAIDDITQQRGTPLMDQLILMKHEIDVMKEDELPRRTVYILQSMKRKREHERQQNEQHAVDT